MWTSLLNINLSYGVAATTVVCLYMDIMSHYYSPRKLHPVLRAKRAEKDRFATGQRNYFLGCLMNVILGVVK